jgi:hypothetical protein
VEGGHVLRVSVRARNVSCRLLISVAAHEVCGDDVLMGIEARPIELVADADGVGQGFGRPAPDLAPFVAVNFANVPVCPSGLTLGDVDDQPFSLEVSVREARREGESTSRYHVMPRLTITPTCADAACACECDAGFERSVPREDQCEGINDDDTPYGRCAAD